MTWPAVRVGVTLNLLHLASARFYGGDVQGASYAWLGCMPQALLPLYKESIELSRPLRFGGGSTRLLQAQPGTLILIAFRLLRDVKTWSYY